MKRLALLFLLLLCAPVAADNSVGPPNAIICNGAANLTAGSSGLQQIQAAATGKTIYICGWHITNTASSGTFSLEYGTGTNCGTGTTVLTPAQSISSSAPATDHIDYAFLAIPIGTALCINTSVSTIAASIWTVQY